MAIPLRLKVFRGDDLVATRDFDRDMIKIGRLATAHLCVEDDRVSRIHSVLNAEGDGKLSIVDMGSVEGTYLNGKRINKGNVQFGDEIRIGNTRITVERPDQEAAAPITATNVLPSPSQEPGLFSEPSITLAGTVAGSVAGSATGMAPGPAGADATGPQQFERGFLPPPEPVRLSPSGAPSLPAAVSPEVLETTAPIDLPGRVRSARVSSGVPGDEGPEPSARFSGVVEDGRHRSYRLNDKPFDSYAPRKPTARTAAAAEKVGLQIRYLWGDTLVHVSQWERPCDVLVGETARCDLRLAHGTVAGPEHTLVRAGASGFELCVADGMRGELTREREVSGLAPGGVELRPSDFAWVELGPIRAELCFAAQPRKALVPIAESIDYSFLNLFLLLFFLGGLFVITAHTRTEVDVVADDLSMTKLVATKFILKDAEKPKKNALLEKLEASKKEAPAEVAQKHKDAEGKMGSLDALDVRKNKSAPKAIDINAKDLVKNSGILKTLGMGGGGGLATIFGSGGLGGDLKGALGNMMGTHAGDSRGFGGLGLKGTNIGGGGFGSTIGIGGIGTKGRGGGSAGYGMGVGGLSAKKLTDVGISDSDSVITGSLDKELIRQVIRRNIQQIRYCYEKELQVKPDLAGKVSVRFVIAPSGDVQGAKVVDGSTINEANLSECITVRVRSWKFPAPKGGGNVIVTYPFVFKQSGE